jgi:hypothetical protein
MKSFIFSLLCAAIIFTAACSEKSTEPPKSNSNPWMSTGAYPITHWNSAQNDVSNVPMPTGVVRVDPANVDFITNSLVNYGFGHVQLPDGTAIAWYSGPSSVGKLRIDGGRFEKLGEFSVPEGQAYYLGSDRLESLLAGLNSAGRDEEKLLSTFRPVFDGGYSTRALTYGIYSIVDRDGFFYVNYGTRLYKFGDAEPGNPLSGIRVVDQLDISERLPEDVFVEGNRIIGVNMTFDGHIVFAFSGGVAVTDRDFESVEFLTFPGEDVENSVAVDSDGGLYLPTSKKMYKFIWTGEHLSNEPADGAWETEYDVSDIKIPGALSSGSGTTPTLIGMGEGEDKLVAISDYGDPAKVVVFWADDIPADFEQKADTKSRRIADQVAVKINVRGTVESSFVGFGNGFVAYNQLSPDPVVEDGPNAVLTTLLLAGFSRATGSGIEKFVWNKAERKLESKWIDRSVPMTIAVPTYNRPTDTLYVYGAEEGVFGIYGLDWTKGEQVSFIELGSNQMFQVFGGFTIPLSENEIWITGGFGPVRIQVD